MYNYYSIRRVDRAVVVELELFAMFNFVCWCLQVIVLPKYKLYFIQTMAVSSIEVYERNIGIYD